MARLRRINYPGAFYHVTSRGNERRDIFKNQRDREKFLSYLESSFERYGAVIHCWCLMPNHYHLLLETPDGNLPQIMRHINGAYSTYFNVKHQRSGHLFQGRYKAFLVDADSYALELSRYIHLNPVRAGLVHRPEDYAWTSYRCFIGDIASSCWLNMKMILGTLSSDEAACRRRYRKFVEDRLGNEYANPLREAVGGVILGRSTFIEQITNDHIQPRCQCGHDEDVSALSLLIPHPTVEQIMSAAAGELGPDARLTERIGLFLSHELSGLPLRELGKVFGKKETAVCEASRRMRRKITADPELAKAVARIRARIKS